MAIGKLSKRLFLLTLVAVLPAAFILFYNLNAIRLAKEQEMRDEALRTGQLASLELQRVISGVENVLIALSAAPVVQNRDLRGCQEYFARVSGVMREIASISLADANGDVICSNVADAHGISVADRPYFQEAIKTGKFVVGNHVIGRISKRSTLPMALPTLDEHGAVRSVAIAALSLDWLNRSLRDRDFAANSTLTIADKTGTILARLPDSENFVGSVIPQKYQWLLHEPKASTIEVESSRDGRRRIFGYYPPGVSPSGLFVSAGLPTEEAYSAINDATVIGAISIVISLILSVALAWLSSRQLIQRPVLHLVQTIDAWRNGNENARTNMSDTSGEVGVVGHAIDDLLGEIAVARQLQQTAEQERQILVGELNHRVKNLMTTVQAVARQTFRERTSDSEAVSIFTERLSAIAEAHALLLKDDWQAAHMWELVTSITQTLSAGPGSRFLIDGPDFLVKARAVLSLSMALHELATNAAKYGALSNSEGTVTIRWEIVPGTDGDDAGSLHLVWDERNGPPVRQPSRFGFGTKMIERVLVYELEAVVTTDYLPTGLVCRLVAPLSKLISDPDAPTPFGVSGAA